MFLPIKNLSKKKKPKEEKVSTKKRKKNSPLFISGPKRCSIDTYEYEDAETAAKYPFLEVSSSGLATSGPLARE